MFPTVHKHLLGVAAAAVIALLAVAPAHAGSAPRIQTAYPVDRDRDGHVDGISLNWSQKVRGGRDSSAPFAFKVPGYRVVAVGRARGKRQRLRVSERTECDAGGSVRVSYKPRRGARPVLRAKGRRRVGARRLDMRRFDTPIPRITCAITLDRDHDARVDGVRVTYSRAVRSRAQRRGRFLFSVDGYRVRAVSAAKGRFLDIAVTERAAPDSAAVPAVGYSRPASRRQKPYAVRSGRRGSAFAGSFAATRDGVSPKPVGARTGDGDGDGRLDTMTVRFSEPVRDPRTDSLAVAGMRVRTVQRLDDGRLVLGLAEGPLRGDARPATWSTGAGLADASGNPAMRAAVTPSDGAAPVMLAAATQDVSGTPGRIDAVTVAFSEPVAHARDAGGDYPFLVSGRRLLSVERGAGRFVQLRLAEASQADTGERPPVRLIPGPGLPLTDFAGNTAAEGFVTSHDAVAPVFLSATTVDGDGDGRLDRVDARFSEDVHRAAEPGEGSFAVAGYPVTGSAAANGREIGILLVEAAAPDSGATPIVSYRRDGVEDVGDAAGNPTRDSAVQAQDGAAPTLLRARTADADDDGKLDRILTTWSENVLHDDDATAPFALAAADATVTRVAAAEGASLAVELTEPGASDTGSTPQLSYAGAGGRIRDAAGLEPERRSWPGLTEDALSPRLVSAATTDSDTDGSLDGLALRFSEPVTHPREDAPASFAVTGWNVLTAEAADGDAIQLRLKESGGPDSGARPAFAYFPDARDDVRDAAGNMAPAVSLPQVTDAARPVVVAAQTADADDDGKLDRVATTWSEPIEHADDSAAPFPMAVEQLAVSRVRAAAGPALDIDLVEPDAPDTGSAPDVTYDGSGPEIRDASGVEALERSYQGLTQDALPPRLVATSTSDGDTDGRLDGVEFEWSEQVTGSTGSGPFSVEGRALAPAVAITGRRARVPFTENAAQYDTHDTPAVAYDAVNGDLRDLPEGLGDMAADVPAVAMQTPLDKAAPILVAARTADLTTPPAVTAPNGAIDAMLVTFSEPIQHAVDGIAPFSLNVANRSETDIEADTGPGDRTLYVRVAESGGPDGGETPNVSVAAVGPAADRVKDRAPVPNEARAMTFTGTEDEVSPVLMSAQLGERGATGGCTKTPVDGIDGQVDCVLTTWSEDVRHDADADGTYSLSSSGWGIDTGGIGNLGPGRTLEVPLALGADPDRDRAGTTVAYDAAKQNAVVDVSSRANVALSATRAADSACRDTGHEPDDVRDPGNFSLNHESPAFERKCAFDDDWFIVTPGSGGHLEVVTRPVSGVDVDIEVYRGATVLTPDVSEPGGPGEIDRLVYSGLTDPGPYWAHVSADDTPVPQEGPYCLAYSIDPATAATCGPLAGQIVFTEVGVGNDKFVEIKNDVDVPVEMEGAAAKLVIGGSDQRQCTLVMPQEDDESIIEPNEHVVIENSAGPSTFGCNQVASLDPAGENLMLEAHGAIDSVPLGGVINSPLAAGHSLQFVESTLDEDHQANDAVATRWCRTFLAHTKAAEGDGCDEYRINEVLWRPAQTADASDGRAFVEIAGNIPAAANSELLGGWVMRGVNGETGDGSEDFVLPAAASPRANGTYVVADGASGQTQVQDPDTIWNSLDLNSPMWPDGTGTLGPRSLQLLMPNPPNTAPCTGAADAFGWITTAQGFSRPLDDLRSCPALELQEYTNSTVGSSAARDNLSSADDTSYNEGRDSGNNRLDFCPQVQPNPGQLNIRPGC